MDSVIGRAIVLVCKYTVFPIARQLKYVCCYKSCVVEMKDAIHKLKNEKEIVEVVKSVAMNGGKLIHKKADDWLEAVTNTQEEVDSLLTYEESKANNMSGCSSIGRQILSPIARHKLGRKATKKKLAIEVLCQNQPQPHEISYDPPPPGIVDHKATASAAAPAKLQTDDAVFWSSNWKHTMKKIMTSLKDDRVNVIGLHGMGGVGKSTMINEVYDQVKSQCMFDEVVRVEVKVKPEITRIQGDIAFQLGLKFENEWSSSIRGNLLRERLLRKKDEKNDTEQKKKDEKNDTKQKLKKKTVLIILDDLWEKLELQEVGIPLGGNDQVQIKLLLTSREEYLLLDKMGSRELIHLNVLNDADALRMFTFVVGVGAEGVKDDIVTEIARNCSGLPIVIEATAKALKDRALDEWAKILKRLDNVDVLEKLKVSYDYLPSKESKELFLICGISHGPRIQVRDLLKYTFGLRLYNRKDSSTLLAAAAKLEQLLSRLEAASMLLKSDDHQYVKIHDHMRELAVRIVEEDHLEWAYDVTLSDNSFELPDASELKLLLSCCEGDAVELRDSFFKDMEKLNVLEFTSLNLRVALSLPSSTTQLDHLRNLETLCFHNCCLGDISRIGELKGLQILSFRGSNIRKLPIQLRELIVLKMLDLSDCEKLTQIEPNVLGSLTKLEELNMENSFKDWEIDQVDDARPPSNARLSELKNMTRLSNVRIHIPRTSMLPRDGQLFSSKLTMYQIMFGVARKDDIHWGKSVEDSDIYREFSYKYNKFSRVLMLTFDSPDIVWQDWVQTTLQTTEVLYLSGRLDEKCKSIGEMCVKGFECLKHLRMRICPSFRFIISSNDGGSSTNLESLFLENLESLENLCGGGLPRHEGAFSKLRVVKVKCCNKLMHLFDFSVLKSRLSSQLEEITVWRCAKIQCIVDEDDNNIYEVVTLSRLQKLEFVRLPKFSSFLAGPSSNVLFTGKMVAFPHLESLKIYVLDELEHIWDPTDPPAELGNLLLLEVVGCDKLVRVINSNVLMRLQRDLEYLTIEYCGLMKEVFQVEDDGIISSSCTHDEHHLVLFSRLKELRLKEMNKLEGIHNNKSLMMTIFPNIESLYLKECHYLRYVLCCSLPTTAGVEGGGGGYENIKEMRIDHCWKMEAIVEVMLKVVDQETQQADNTNSIADQLLLFRRLKRLSLSLMKSLKGIYNLSGREDRVVTMFPDIETLHVSYCRGLRYVLPAKVGGWVHLREIRITGCDQMEAIVLSGAVDQETQPAAAATGVSYSFSSLQRMEIESCPKLRTFCHYISSEQDSAADDLPFFSQKEIFPCLESLNLEDLSKLGEIWPREVPPQSSFNMLKEVIIDACPVSMVFPSKLIARLENLTYIGVWHCDEMRQIIRVEEKNIKLRHVVHGGGSNSGVEEKVGTTTAMEMMFTFPCLTTLLLTDLQKLDRFCSSSACCLQFPSLETVEIESCGGLKTLFSQRQPAGLVDGIDHDSESDMAHMDGALFRSCDRLAIPSRKSIFLENSECLEKLCGGGLPRHEEAFSKLRVVKVKCCNKLTHLFDFSVLKNLLSSQLEEITVWRCAKIQCIVVDEVDNNNYEVVTLSSLQKLEFRSLPKFSSFCAGPSSNVLFAGKKVAFRRLESLEIFGLDELEHIWHPTDPPIELGNLRLLHVKKCNKLERVINSNVLMRLQRDLESLNIDQCRLMKEVFDVEDDGIINSSCTDDELDLVLFSQLKQLQLQNNKNLMMMMKGGSRSMTIFSNIESLYVHTCDHLRYVLCCSLPNTAGVGGGGGGYENIKEITIAYCGEMEAIVEVMLKVVDQETQQADNGSSIADQLVLFRRLKVLSLESMKSLKGIYNLSGRDDRVGTMFPDIETLDVRDCDGLRYVICVTS